MWDWDLLQSILVVLLVLLAIVGLWHLAARACGYKVLPMYQRSACGSQVHQLAYITEHERHQLMAAGGSGKAQPGTQGVPCYPNKRKREPTIEPVDPDDSTKDAATKIIRNRRNNARAWRRYDILRQYRRELDFKTPFVDDIQAPQTNDAWVPILPDPDPQ